VLQLEPDSVLSVATAAPPIGRLVLVASFVSRTAGAAARGAGAGGVQARCATLMPEHWSHSTLALLALVFAPRLELRLNRRRSKLLGLRVAGVVEEVTLTTHIDLQDLTAVDRIREALTLAMAGGPMGGEIDIDELMSMGDD
jgi:hypothetical protein